MALSKLSLKNPLYLVIIGPSGGGKGTQAELLEKKYGLAHVSTGELLRKEVENKTELGKKALRYITKGIFVPTPLVLRVLEPVLNKIEKRGFVLEGFPRLPDQPQFLESFLKKRGIFLNAVLDLKVRAKIVIKRKIAKGEKFQSGRGDDTVELLKKRLESYEKTIAPIRKFYQKKGLLIEVDGERSIEAIFKDIVFRLEKHLKNDR